MWGWANVGLGPYLQGHFLYDALRQTPTEALTRLTNEENLLCLLPFTNPICICSSFVDCLDGCIQ